MTALASLAASLPASTGSLAASKSSTKDTSSPSPVLLTMREGKDGGGKGPLISDNASLTLGTSQTQTLFDGPSVRRLTPVETERLMGWPDGHTIVAGWSTRSTNGEAGPTTTKRKRGISSRAIARRPKRTTPTTGSDGRPTT